MQKSLWSSGHTPSEKAYLMKRRMWKGGLGKKPLPPPPSKEFDQKKMAKIPFGKKMKKRRRK